MNRWLLCRLTRPILPLLGLLALALFSCPTRAAETSSSPRFAIQVIKDVPYYQGADFDKVKHKLDLFLPRGQKDYPVLFFVHGGAWLRGDKSFLGLYSSLGMSFARQGIGAVVINYRLSPGVRHPEHIKDVARAFAWTYRNIAQYGGRPDQIFVCGHSAGAHLISLLVTDEHYLQAEGLTVQAIKGAIPLSGIYYLPEDIFPMVFGRDPEVHRQASPLTHVKAGLPPFLILYADHDLPGCDRLPAETFCKALRDKGNKAEIREIKESSHIQIIFGAAIVNDPVSRAILGFIAAHKGA